jgi:hypothetical protein
VSIFAVNLFGGVCCFWGGAAHPFNHMYSKSTLRYFALLSNAAACRLLRSTSGGGGLQSARHAMAL